MKTNWFRKIGWFYIPSSIIGIVLYVVIIFFCVNVFIAIDRHSHSVSDTLYGIFPYFVSAFTVLFWIASNTSDNEKIKNLKL
jgi:hypothetical protein